MNLTLEAGSSFFEKMERHIAAQKATSMAVQEWDEKRTTEGVNPVIYAGALAAVSKAEQEARASIVMHEPSDRAESDRKLEYLAAFIIATRNPLDQKEMEVIEMIADRRALKERAR